MPRSWHGRDLGVQIMLIAWGLILLQHRYNNNLKKTSLTVANDMFLRQGPSLKWKSLGMKSLNMLSRCDRKRMTRKSEDLMRSAHCILEYHILLSSLPYSFANDLTGFFFISQFLLIIITILIWFVFCTRNYKLFWCASLTLSTTLTFAPKSSMAVLITKKGCHVSFSSLIL